MNYFVTGLTGFIGQQFLQVLSKRKGKIFALVRESSVHKIEKLRFQNGLTEDQLVAVTGDLSAPLCGVDPTKLGPIDHFFHLGAVYNLAARPDIQIAANMEGTKQALALAESLNVKCFHHTSSIVAGGFYPGEFKEDMFEEAVGLEKNAYFKTKHDSEGLVRNQSSVPYRIYRPGIVVGHSKTGWINKVDGPYYFFNLINTIAHIVPRWVPLPKYKGAPINIVPVDFVTAAMDHIAHKENIDGQCFHLTNPEYMPFGKAINLFLKAAKGPKMQLDIPAERLLDFLPVGWRKFTENKAIVAGVKMKLMQNLGIPKEVLLSEYMHTTYDCSNTLAALEGSGISCPKLKTYSKRLWHYWEQYLNPEHHKPQYLPDIAQGKVILITGGSEGIGKQVAINCAEAGAKVIIVARTQSKLDAVAEQIKVAGGEVATYKCDLTDLDALDDVSAQILEDHGRVDILVNNAGRSIRRSLKLTYERFHDFERVMQLNYFSAVRLTMNLLPSMVDKRQGHVINISSIAVMTPGSARFSSYVASKSAMDAWSNSASYEYAADNIKFTNIHMPLVRTKMISATQAYNDINVLTVEQAGKLVTSAMINQPAEVNTVTGDIIRQLGIVAPKLSQLLLTTIYQLTDDSEAAKASAHPTMDKEAIADRAMDALHRLHLDKATLESIDNILRGYHT